MRRMKRLFAIVSLVSALVLPQARADIPDDQYVHIYNLIQQADSLNNLDQPVQAMEKYNEAQTALRQFQAQYPAWHVKVVNFRLNYLASKIAAVSIRIHAVPAPIAITPTAPAMTPAPAPGVAPATTVAPAAIPTSPAAPSDLDHQLAALQEEVRQLQADKGTLESKLKEALATQPAAVDPRELAKAQDKVQSLMKENDLLKTSLTAEQTKAAQGVSPKELEESKQALAEANRKLAEETTRANALTMERKLLQNRLDALTPGKEKMAEYEVTKKALDDANRRLAEQTELATKLTGEKEAMLARINTLTTTAEAADALRAENQLLKKQLAQVQWPAVTATKVDDLTRQLAQAEARIAALQSDAEILRLERTALENRVRKLNAQAVAVATPPPVVSRPEDLQRIKQLEGERDDLQKKLETANKELSSRRSKATAARIGELQNQISTLRARMDVFEARAVPYTTEELTLFKTPEPQLAVATPKTVKKSINELPPGSATLVAEAQRYFNAKQYDKAEEKYLDILRQDESNVATLANLGAIQLEQGHLDEAEKHIKQALAAEPDDVYSLALLGQLRLRQEKYDEALDLLSRAAKLNPQNAEIQNYLGVALSHKGMRRSAETAFRKAIQLEPHYGSAHNNLAVIYAAQQPPLMGLARWHYQKALATGLPRNLELEKKLESNTPASTAP